MEVKRNELEEWIGGLTHFPERTQVYYCLDDQELTGPELLSACLEVLSISHEACQDRGLEAILMISLDRRHASTMRRASALAEVGNFILDFGSYGRPDIMIHLPNTQCFHLPDSAIEFRSDLETRESNIRSQFRIYRSFDYSKDIAVMEPLVWAAFTDVDLRGRDAVRSQ